MKPGISPWATNDEYSSLIPYQEGEPTKVEPSDAEYEQGFRANQVVHPVTWNDWRSRCEQLIKRVGSLQVCTLFEEPVDSTAEPTDTASIVEDYIWGGSIDKYSDAASNYFKYVVYSNKNALVYATREIALDEQPIWRADTAGRINYGTPSSTQVQYIPSSLATRPTSLGGTFSGTMYLTGHCIDKNYDRVITYSSTDGIYYSSGFDFWTYWPSSTGTVWAAVDTDEDGLWVFFDDTNNRLYSAPSLGGTLTQRSTAATGSGQSVLIHSRHQADDLYDGDPGNPYWMFFGGSKATGAFLVSSNGTSWSTGTLGFTLYPLCEQFIRYSKLSQRWVILHDSDISGVNSPTVIYSDDNGANWQEVDDAFGMEQEDTPPIFSTCNGASFDTDGHGNWLMNVMVDEGASEVSRFYASSDDAMTWQRVFPNFDNTGEVSGGVGSVVWHGEGSFNCVQAGSFGGSTTMTLKPFTSVISED